MNFKTTDLFIRTCKYLLVTLLLSIFVAHPNSFAVPDNSFKTGTGNAERVYLNGSYVQAGVALNGRFGPSGAVPTIAGVTWHPSGGRSNLGFVADRNRDGTWLDTDFFYPGSPLEGWALRYDSNQLSISTGDASYSSSGGSVPSFSFSDVDVSETSTSVVHTTVIDDLRIAQTYQVRRGSGTFTNDQRLSISVTITNNSASAIGSLYYSRLVDPDNLQDVDGSYTTRNTIVSQYGTGGKTYSLVSATKSDSRQSPEGTSYIGLVSTDSRSKVSYGGFGFISNLTDMFTDGFVSGSNTFQSNVGDSESLDRGIQLLGTLGSLAAGESTTFDLAYVLSEVAASDAAGEDVGSSSSGTVAPTTPASLLTFATNGADNNSLPQSEIKGTTVRLWRNILTRAGYEFIGWNTKADGSGITYGDQALFKFDADYITLYAQWSLIQSTPTITWSNPAYITTTTPLSFTQLNATASVPGSCAYSPALGATLPTGKQTLTCLFTPTDTTKYKSVSKSVEIEVLALPVVTWANPAAIANGSALGSTQLNATANMSGSFTYAPAAATVLKPGKQKLTVTFTPTDTRLAPVIKEVEIEILPALSPTAQAITTKSGASANGAIGSTTKDATVAVKTVGKGLDKATATAASLTVTAKSDFSGLTSVVITVTDEGRSIDLNVPVTVLPNAPTNGSYQLTSLNSSVVTWSAANGALSYQVLVNGAQGCTATAESCQLDIPLGPKSSVTVKSLGADNTSSDQSPASYKSPASPIEAATVNFASAKFNLSKAARTKLDALAKSVAELGLTRLQVQGHTDSVGGIDNQRLSNQRAKAALDYLSKQLPGVRITITGFGPNQPAADNQSKEGKAANRRAVVLIS